MLYAWLDLPLGGILGALIAFYALTALLIFWLLFYSPLRAPIQSCVGVVAPYFGAIALLFALLTGFLAADIADRNRQATRAVQSEAEALTSMHALSIASVSDMARVRNAIRAYAGSVTHDEWPLIPTGRGAPQTDAALSALMQTVADPATGRDAGQPVHNALVNLTMRVAAARADRLALGTDRTNEIKWYTVLILCLITQVSIGIVHLERPRANALALTIFSIAAVVALGLIAEQESPFDGTLQVSKTPLENVLRLTPPPNNPNG
ncbi:MAG TPA: hypothetical protein VHD14_00170 [Pseudolabrys sp.]|nr:hypothetical protein [Pseudolabrys sp.]